MMNPINFKKLLLCILVAVWYLILLLSAFNSDLSLTMVSHPHTDLKVRTSAADAKTVIHSEFTAPYNYLGMLFIHFDKFKQPANEEIIFLIRDLSSNEVVLNTTKLSGQIITQLQFPIGVTPIPDSQNKKYSFEVIYQNSAFKQPLSLNQAENILVTKYVFPIDSLIKNPFFLLEIISNKIIYGFKMLPQLTLFALLPLFFLILYFLRHWVFKISIIVWNIIARIKKKINVELIDSKIQRYVQNMSQAFLSINKKVADNFQRIDKNVVSNKELTRNKIIIFIFISIISVVLKLFISQTWYNFDIESWRDVSDIVRNGNSVYAHTWRYNYGPIWSYILGFLGFIRSLFGNYHIQDLHLIITLFLSLVDIALSLIIIRFYGYGYGLLFALNPISILLTGFHGQFDNLAILVAFIGWLFLLKSEEKKSLKLYLISACILGTSLIIKHILIFFPVWLILAPSIFKLRHKILHSILTYIVFISGFLFDILIHINKSQQVIEGIKTNVIAYKSQYGYSFMANTVNLFFTENLLSTLFGWIPVFKDLTFLFLCAVVISGYIFTKNKQFSRYLLPLYLLSFYVFTPSIADQYFVIPLIVIILFPSNFFALISTVLFFFHISSIGYSNINSVLITKASMFVTVGGVSFSLLPWRGTEIIWSLDSLYAQAWIGLFYLSLMIKGIEKKVKNMFSVIVFWLFVVVNIYFVFQIILFIIMYQNQAPDDKISHISTFNNTCTDLDTMLYSSCMFKKECKIPLKDIKKSKTCVDNLQIEWSCNNITKYRILDKDIQNNIHLVCPEKKIIPDSERKPLRVIE